MGYVFISYSRDDRTYADRLVEYLGAAGVSTWIDTAAVDYGTTWPRVIRDGLMSCSAFVVIMSPRAEESEWVQIELHSARREGKPVFPILLEGEPFFELVTIRYEDVTHGNLPSRSFASRLAEVAGPEKTTDRVPDRLPSDTDAAAPKAAKGAPLLAKVVEPSRLAELAMSDGDEHCKAQRYDDALDAYGRAIELDPNNAQLHARRGRVLGHIVAHQHDPDDGLLIDALDAYGRAIELDPNNAQLHVDRGWACTELGDNNEALVAFDRAVELDPNNAQLHADRSWALALLERHDEALAASERAIEIEPSCFSAYGNRAWSLMSLKRPNEALVACDRGLELEPTSWRLEELRHLAAREAEGGSTPLFDSAFYRS